MGRDGLTIGQFVPCLLSLGNGWSTIDTRRIERVSEIRVDIFNCFECGRYATTGVSESHKHRVSTKAFAQVDKLKVTELTPHAKLLRTLFLRRFPFDDHDNQTRHQNQIEHQKETV